MYKLILLTVLFTCSLLAKYEIYEDENIFTIKVFNKKFKDLFINLKDEINYQSYIIVNELNLAQSANSIANALEKKNILKNGKNILICKRSFLLKMIKENIHNITYCPLSISVYEKNKIIYLSYRKYQALKKRNFIAKDINKKLKSLILKALN